MEKTNKKCLHCGALTINPRFCGRSCATAYNNKSSPKRKLEGMCNICGISITTAKKLCEKCKSIEVQKNSREMQNIHIFQGPSGKFEKKLPRIYCDHNYVFSNSAHDKLNNETTCETLIDYLLSLLTQKPAYVIDTDIRWLSAMLVHLLQTEIECKYLPNRIGPSITKIPVAFIGSYLEEWVWSFFKEDYHPLLPTFALITCQFIDRHLFGYKQYKSFNNQVSWKIEPLVGDDSNNNYYKRIGFLNNATFKKNFTEKMGFLQVTCKIPEDSILEIPDYLGKNVSGPANIDLNVTHCHLSQSSSQYFVFCKIEGSREIEFDIFADAEFTGSILQINDSIDTRKLRCVFRFKSNTNSSAARTPIPVAPEH